MTALTDLLLRSALSRGRLLAGVAAGLVLIGLGVVVLLAGGDAGDARAVVRDVGTGLLVPLVAVVVGTSVLGDPAEDGTIAYLLTTPQPRLRIALPAFVATAVVVVPLTAVPVMAVLTVNGLPPGSVVAAGAGTAAAACAYGAVFLALGVLLRRALLVGLLYSAIWEGIVAGVADGLARLSIRAHGQTVTTWLDGATLTAGPVTGPTALLVLTGLTVGGLLATAGLLRRHVARS